MTYNVFGETLSLNQSINHVKLCFICNQAGMFYTCGPVTANDLSRR